MMGPVIEYHLETCFKEPNRVELVGKEIGQEATISVLLWFCRRRNDIKDYGGQMERIYLSPGVSPPSSAATSATSNAISPQIYVYQQSQAILASSSLAS